MADRKDLTELVRDAVDKGATSVEEIHRSIANLPLNILEKLEVWEGMVSDIRKVQDQTIGAIYDLIRTVNEEIATIAHDAIQARKDEKKAAEEAAAAEAEEEEEEKPVKAKAEAKKAKAEK